MSVCDTNGFRHNLVKIGCKGSISNPRLSKCHNLNILLPKTELRRGQKISAQTPKKLIIWEIIIAISVNHTTLFHII